MLPQIQTSMDIKRILCLLVRPQPAPRVQLPPTWDQPLISQCHCRVILWSGPPFQIEVATTASRCLRHVINQNSFTTTMEENTEAFQGINHLSHQSPAIQTASRSTTLLGREEKEVEGEVLALKETRWSSVLYVSGEEEGKEDKIIEEEEE